MPLTHFFELHLHDLITRQPVKERWKQHILRLVFSLSMVLLVTGFAWLLTTMGFPAPESLSVLFILPVLFVAIFHGFWMGSLTALLAMISYDLLLLMPTWHITLFDPQIIAKLAIFILVALVAAALASRTRQLRRETMEKEHILSGLYALSHDMVGIVDAGEMREAAETRLSGLLEAEVVVLLKQDIPKDAEAAWFCIGNDTPTGQGTKYFSSHADLHLPLKNRQGVLGVMQIKGAKGILITQRFPAKVLATLSAQTASALEKAMLAESHEKKLREAEKEKFLAALLSSVSHDFKTPLVTVIGAFSSLESMPGIKSDFGCRELVTGGLEEARKLNRFITNLVEISRLEAGIENIHKEPVLLRDMLASALKSLHPLIHKQRFTITVPMDFPLMNVNSALMELVFLNLLENAIKYGPVSGEVKIIARYDGNAATIDIDDDGDGISESEREAIFVKFYRSRYGDSKIAGTGLGLYICRSIVEAHGGSIAAIDPHDGQGACVRITLPQAVLIPINLLEETEEA